MLGKKAYSHRGSRSVSDSEAKVRVGSLIDVFQVRGLDRDKASPLWLIVTCFPSSVDHNPLVLPICRRTEVYFTPINAPANTLEIILPFNKAPVIASRTSTRLTPKVLGSKLLKSSTAHRTYRKLTTGFWLPFRV